VRTAKKLYFAYGSNINLDQMARRCPEATVVEPVTLENYELLFRGNGGGCGVATISPKEGSTVHGLLWNLSPKDEKALDFYEGYPHLYDKQPVNVRTQNGSEITVMAYVMTREKERIPTEPTVGYFDGIWEGFEENGLPTHALEQAIRHVWQETAQVRQQKQTYKHHER
jgi:gamma-glutamylcyclotransferase (GGCT)/AIG2-like uncharacterized protein YtfP